MRKPTVTELVGMLDKPALLKWANKIGLQGISLEDYRKKLTTAGTSLHQQIQDYFLYKKPFESIDVQNRFNKLFSDKEIIDIEQNINTDWFYGRYDIKFKFGNDLFIGDFKSNNNIYLEQKLQLTAYRMANPECKIAVIEIPSFTFKPIEIDFKKCELILKCLHKIWELKQYI
jgi:hypothetical protein